MTIATFRRANGIEVSKGGGRLLAVLVLALVLSAGPVSAEGTTGGTAAASPTALRSSAVPGFGSPGLGLPLFHFLDSDRLTWNQSLTFGYTSGGSYQGTAGLYTSSFGYRVSDPLRLRLDLGAHVTPGFRGSPATQGVFLQGLSLDWRLAHNSFLHVSYQDMRSPLMWRGLGWGSSPFDPLGVEPASPN